MTREEAIKRLKEVRNTIQPFLYVDEAIDYAIKALEQSNVLDKIRAEIEPKCDRINSLASELPYTAHREIQELLCEIMDLCKAEREVEECIKNG